MSGKTKLGIILSLVLFFGSCFSELSLHDLETQDVDVRNYKYDKLREHFPNKYRPISYK